MFDFNSYQIEEHLAEDAIFQVEFTLVELKFNVQALLDPDLHFNRPVHIWLTSDVGDYEFFLLGDLIIIPVDYHIDVVA